MSDATAETWLFDLGNSRAKAARLVRGEPADVLALDWEHPRWVATMRRDLDRWPRPVRVWVASVASAERVAKMRAALAGLEAQRIEWLRTPRRAGGVTNSYARPERLGVDRFLAMLAAHARAPEACVVAGCGTALTLDALTADGTHAEGMIALSPERMLQALHAATAIADGNPDAFAGDSSDDTAAALNAGCWASAGALVEWFAARRAAVAPAPRIWLHGGWAAPLAAWLERDGVAAGVLDHAVLRGLAVWAAQLCDHP